MSVISAFVFAKQNFCQTSAYFWYVFCASNKKRKTQKN